MDSKTSKYVEGQMYQIPVSQIKPNPDQPRKHIDKNSMEELKTSIKEKGVYIPLIACVVNKNVTLIDGQRRLEVAKQLKLKEVPVVIFEGDKSDASFIANILREDLHIIDRAEALKKIKDKHKYTQEQLAKMIGKKQNTISDMLRILDLPEKILNKCRNEKRWSLNRLLRIVKISSPKQRDAKFKEIEENLNSIQSREKVVLHKVIGKRLHLLEKNFNKVDPKELGKDEKKQLKTQLSQAQQQIEELLGKL